MRSLLRGDHGEAGRTRQRPWPLPNGSNVERVLIGRLEPTKKIVAAWIPHGNCVAVLVASAVPLIAGGDRPFVREVERVGHAVEAIALVVAVGP